jgi:predicted nucleotidyltransferase
MKLPENIKKQIIDALKPLDPEKVILFGSYAWGEPTKDSDIDLYIVTKDEFMPKNWREKSEIYIEYIQKLDELNSKYGLDLITHTKAMHQKFIEMDGMFCRKILRDGVRLYEKSN